MASSPAAPVASIAHALGSGAPRLQGPRVLLRRPTPNDHTTFVAMVHDDYDSIRPWVEPPTTPHHFEEWVLRCGSRDADGFLVTEIEGGAIVGAVDLNGIARGIQQSAQLAYYVGGRHAGRGLMTEAVDLVLGYAFQGLGLHRIEANVQPANERSRALVRRLGFRREGFSPGFLRIAGQWRDHERWALLREEWSPRTPIEMD